VQVIVTGGQIFGKALLEATRQAIKSAHLIFSHILCVGLTVIYRPHKMPNTGQSLSRGALLGYKTQHRGHPPMCSLGSTG